MSSPFGISCTSSADYLVTGEAALTTANDGRTWARHATPGGVALGPVTCPLAKDCYAIFDVTSAVPSNELTYLYTSVNGGVSWKEVLASPRHVAGLGGISCPSTSTCVTVGYGHTPPGNRANELYALSELTSTAGRHWAQSTTAKAQALFADSCAAKTRDCIAGGETRSGTAVILKSANDGTTWTAEPRREHSRAKRELRSGTGHDCVRPTVIHTAGRTRQPNYALGQGVDGVGELPPSRGPASSTPTRAAVLDGPSSAGITLTRAAAAAIRSADLTPCMNDAGEP